MIPLPYNTKISWCLNSDFIFWWFQGFYFRYAVCLVSVLYSRFRERDTGRGL